MSDNTPIIFSPIKSRRSFDEIALEVKELIFKGVLKPGDKLPSETELARQFKLGRQTIREALRVLELSGFITVQKGYGGGPTIADNVLSRIGSLFFDALRFDKISLEELTVARIKIERMIMGEVFSSIDEKGILLLENNIEKAKHQIAIKKMATSENLEFHQILAVSTQNQVFAIVTGAVLGAMGAVMSNLPKDVSVSKQAIVFHERILKAIKQKKKRLAIKLMQMHLEQSKEGLEKSPGKLSEKVQSSGRGAAEDLLLEE